MTISEFDMKESSTPTRSFYLEERHEAILTALDQNDMVRVVDLSKQFHVSTATIRKDIRALERQGKLRRTHGGALPPRVPGSEDRVEVAATSAHNEKVRIGRAAASYVSDGDALLVQNGTTCLEFVRALADHRDLTVITCDLSIALAAESALTQSTVIVLGGNVRVGFHYTQGSDAARQLENYCASTAFLCANAFSFEHGVTAHRREQASWVRTLMQNSERHIMLLDSSKIGEQAAARVTGLDKLDVFITDRNVDAPTRQKFIQSAPHLEMVYA